MDCHCEIVPLKLTDVIEPLLNADMPIFVIVEGNSIDDKVQYGNAYSPIVVTFEGTL